MSPLSTALFMSSALSVSIPFGTDILFCFRTSFVISLFLVKGTIIGLVGSIFGLILALFFGWVQMKYHILSIAEDIYFMDHVPVSFDFSQILVIIFFGTTCSLLASLWPTNIASRVKPADALRYE